MKDIKENTSEIKVDAFEMPKPQYVEVEMYSIEWNTGSKTPNRPLPKVVVATVDLNEGNLIAQAIKKATDLTGYTMKDVNFRPIDYGKIIGPSDEEWRKKIDSIKERT